MTDTPAAGSGASHQAAIDAVEKIQLGMMQATDPSQRGQHFKQHGCVWARFEVPADIPDRYKVGVFAQPGVYTAYVRFSNGAQLDDTHPDIHGMAIKLTGVPGRKVLEAEAEATTHDFILADNPVFFIRTAEDYARFMVEFAKTAPQGKPPVEFIEYLGERYGPNDVAVITRFRQQRPDSPLAARYWSQVPYAFGADAGAICRYAAVPHDGNLTAPIPDGTRSKEYLREAMVEHLTERGLPARFDFTVQVREGATEADIDNPTVEWDVPSQRVAVITIPPQAFDTPQQQAFGEGLSYTPWHALPEHRPLGQVNEIRKAVYLASSDLRHDVRKVPRAEPTGHEHWSFNMRLSHEELTASIDDDFKAVVARLQQTFNFLAGQKHGRATHTYGAAAYGEARCIVPADFPPNDVFILGRIYPIILRHSSPGARPDDRARDGMAASIKFFPPDAGYDGEGFHDILMNAGRQLFVRSIRDFSTFVHAGPDERRELIRKGIMLNEQLREAYRIRGSFINSRYHSWVCFEFTDDNGVMRYIRFRLIHHDRGPDRGLPNAAFEADGQPSMDAEPDDPRAPDFLRQDFIHQVKRSDVRYLLQAQLHDAPNPPVEDHELLDPSQPWNEYWYPWVDLFEIRLTEPILDNDVMSRLDMNPNRSPHCIKIPLATSPDHFASLGHARAIVYPGARAVRADAPAPQNN